MPELTVRPYMPADRAAVLRIAADTAFFEPAEAFLHNPFGRDFVHGAPPAPSV